MIMTSARSVSASALRHGNEEERKEGREGGREKGGKRELTIT